MMNIIGGLTLCPCFSLLPCKKYKSFNVIYILLIKKLTGGVNERGKVRENERERERERGRDKDRQREKGEWESEGEGGEKLRERDMSAGIRWI